ncbi:hypothetical protein (DUF2603 domain) [Campylobacter subantarcticus LMG 24377]|uniref:UPF0763 protein CSUB8521_1296 n=2 Tax=Campylobacter subantarcticus TaxID=497724 RepID=A0A0A8HAY4_9BACT|nr:DUF2603 domain-containing protein [Campylobacter subantarcticus]EAJ1261677.1 DUF2603 domain-containing protein [Campylobacter lari]AJC91127.1 hypothetical protein (DUF2603 domain) [Campylobacter subantarcticus LMG 24374]AJC92905.1 hypothetical protein (DUF2603 domain) [Campylobacter subantarcticus LMG 24377]EAL3939703.1 DUF2603 domain-containing protein [Campylobacter lari]MPB99913.1 DUF2603 domain-containing protein [Campylobacter subantarcticus]
MNSLDKKSSEDIINELSNYLGIEKHNQTIFHLTHINEKEKKLSLKNGHELAHEPWFIVDKNDEVKTMFSVKTLIEFLQNAKEIQKNNFELKLEKAIYQQIPIDFNDVWTVAMDEIKHQVAKGIKEVNIDLDQLVSNIHIQHPNLFIDMKKMIEKVKPNERL